MAQKKFHFVLDSPQEFASFSANREMYGGFFTRAVPIISRFSYVPSKGESVP
jgi:hypothetical protein